MTENPGTPKSPGTPGAPRRIRAGDADRDRVVAALQGHREAGRLTPDEFEERMEAALRAVYLDELPGAARRPAGRQRPWRATAVRAPSVRPPTAGPPPRRPAPASASALAVRPGGGLRGAGPGDRLGGRGRARALPVPADLAGGAGVLVRPVAPVRAVAPVGPSVGVPRRTVERPAPALTRRPRDVTPPAGGRWTTQRSRRSAARSRHAPTVEGTVGAGPWPGMLLRSCPRRQCRSRRWCRDRPRPRRRSHLPGSVPANSRSAVLCPPDVVGRTCTRTASPTWMSERAAWAPSRTTWVSLVTV